jgi:BirA family biotin operon repressor/biotin-[acetyl-CoA-carboxylase] ligase
MSPYGKNLYMTLGLRYEKDFEALNGLSLAVGVAVARSIAELSLDAKLKWPNDVWLEKKKVAGILVEVDGEQGGPLNLVIGIGVNINMRYSEADIDQPWTSLASELDRLVDRSAFAASLINNLLAIMEQFEQQGFMSVKREWIKYDGVSGNRVMLVSHAKTDEGMCRGVDDRGYLLLESGGEIRAFSGGELSLRIAT